jgi:hypothetical protein
VRCRYEGRIFCSPKSPRWQFYSSAAGEAVCPKCNTPLSRSLPNPHAPDSPCLVQELDLPACPVCGHKGPESCNETSDWEKGLREIAARIGKIEIYLERADHGADNAAPLQHYRGVVADALSEADEAFECHGALCRVADGQRFKPEIIAMQDDNAWKAFLEKRAAGRPWYRWHGGRKHGRWNVIVFGKV